MWRVLDIYIYIALKPEVLYGGVTNYSYAMSDIKQNHVLFVQ